MEKKKIIELIIVLLVFGFCLFGVMSGSIQLLNIALLLFGCLMVYWIGRALIEE